MKSFFAWLISSVFVFCLASPAFTAHAETSKTSTGNEEATKSAIVIEGETGKVLYEKNANKELPPASMTKVMTMLLIFKALSHHQISLKDKVTVSENAASMGGSQVFLEPGETMTVDEMLRAIAIASGNDASVAMAEHLSGSVPAFVKQMNAEAKMLGLKHTHFVNPTGLPVADHYTTAHDMAIMAQALARYQQVFHYTSKYEDYLRENTDKKFWLVNTNKLIKTYPGADGMKTGFTNEAKYCLTATAKRNGMRVIAVVMGAPTPKARNKEVASLMNQAFATYTTKEIMKKGQTVVNEKVEKGNYSHVPVVTERPTVLLLKKGEQAKGLKKRVEWNGKLQAPIKRGSVVGYYVVRQKNKVVSKTPLVVNVTVTRASWWQLFKRSAGMLLTH
ncbi:D-alanyl-D-alanine carboxypeptidase family protein [Sporolactobacillus spathodeae]|uniref:serine-type D-Ala-D-Ala carboxypeptidase n=1 Tax=Sporolactobacillus spathodeae TaxID=1465502 RepID=A0ABS2Q953_9BACL|nr:D-alanyl-D-alanine carboxypeptidase family protein [Sporolactobacillus spathodeae]MBM7657860.1 D-alanyl-D-alanine carboxypeptidase (penicillin-binding protein 5/6) [Sporolactobacillus spathodeae]